MDWFTWLSKTGLNPALVYEYGLAFTHNELGEDDISYFDHEFLQSMGISIAKHRLEILKLARSTHKPRRPTAAMLPLIPRLVSAIRSTKSRVRKYIKRWVARNEEDEQPSSALVLVHKDNYSNPSNGYYGSSLKRNKKKGTTTSHAGNSGGGTPAIGELLMLTNGPGSTPASNGRLSASPAIPFYGTSGRKKKKKDDGDAEEGYRSTGVEEISSSI